MKSVDIMVIVKELIHAEELELEHRESVRKAHQLINSEGIDFSDDLLGAIHRANGCAYILTFDQGAAANGLFRSA